MRLQHQAVFMNTEYLNYFFTKTNFTAMQKQTNTIENLTDAELVNITGGDGYAPAGSSQDYTAPTPQQAAEEALKFVTGTVYY